MNEQPMNTKLHNTTGGWLAFVQKPPVLFGGFVALVLVLVAGGLALWQPWQQPTKHQATTTPAPTVAVIEITPTGFVPSTLTVPAGAKVVWVNEDVMPHLPAADPYPTHSSLPSLVAPRALGQKETYSFLFTKAATLHYHDDINPTLVGTVVVR